MARYRGIWRLCYGWCLLCCILSNVEAATRVPVNLPSVQAQVEGAGASSLFGGALKVSTAPLEGEYIAAATKNVPVRGILGGTTFGLNTIATGVKGVLRGGVAAVLAGAAFDQLIKGIGWVMDQGVVSKQLPGPPVTTAPANGEYYWSFSGGYKVSNPSDGCALNWKQSYTDSGFANAGFTIGSSGASVTCNFGAPLIGGSYATGTRSGSHCPVGSSYSSSSGTCLSSTPQIVPVTDSDMGLVDAFLNAQNSDFLRNILKATCQGSLAPARCYDSMKQQALALQGPSTVPGETTTKATTIANPDGTTSSVVTTDSSTYNLTYGPDYFDYSKTTQSNTTTNGKPTSSTTTSDAPSDPNADPTKEQPSDPVASPCGTNCDGPAYQKLYEPTKDTKEQALDSYASRVADLPILKAATGFFNVSVGGGCPVWQVNTSLEVMSASMPINLIFDFHCQGWFTSVASYASAVMAIVCAFLAFRQAFLD